MDAKAQFNAMANARLDQDWAAAAEWADGSDPFTVKRLVDHLAADDPKPLIWWMKQDPLVADIVQRLALLALHEVASRKLAEPRT